jgi:U3 small nucleolar RNA-associated protein 18
MPPTRLKEKTKRTAASSEKTPMNQQPVDDIDMDDETSSDEEDLPEKDEAELKLERMLFGDDEGFMGALKNQQERADAMQLTLHSDEESGSGEEGEESYEDNVENMADADVCTLSSVHLGLICETMLTRWVVGSSFPRLRRRTRNYRSHSFAGDSIGR